MHFSLRRTQFQPRVSESACDFSELRLSHKCARMSYTQNFSTASNGVKRFLSLKNLLETLTAT